jgi:putative spermidine/putrescine transport system permease protein
MHRPVSLFTIAAGGIVLLFLILPNLVIVPVSFSASEFQQFPPTDLSLRWYQRFFADQRWVEALMRSLRIGIATSMLSVLLGTCAAFGLARGRFVGVQGLAALVLAPLVVPHVILAAGLYVFYVDVGLLRTELGLILAHTIIATPIVVITVTASLRSVRRDLELAAMSLGAGYVETFVKVTLPQVSPGMIAGALLAFVTSFDELVLAIFLGGVRSTTLPMRMWEGITVESNPVLPAASTILIAFSTLPLLSLELARRWRAGRARRRDPGPFAIPTGPAVSESRGA